MRNKATEAGIQRACMDLLKAMRLPAIRFNAGMLLDRTGHPVSFARWMDGTPATGLPDLMVLIDGRVLFVELKSEDGKQRPSQVDFEEWARLARCSYVIVRSVDELLVAIRDRERP